MDDVFSKAYREEPALVTVLSGYAAEAAPADAAPQDGDTNLKRMSSRVIEQAIRAANGNMSDAARRLGISRNTLYRRLKQIKAGEAA